MKSIHLQLKPGNGKVDAGWPVYDGPPRGKRLSSGVSTLLVPFNFATQLFICLFIFGIQFLLSDFFLRASEPFYFK